MTKPVDPYHSEYDGFYAMKWHDAEENALKRWFENFKIERYAHFANDYECLIVEEVPASGKHIKKKQICRIENEGQGTTREVPMDHTAPPAPMVFFAAKQRYVPPPPKSAADIRKEEEWRRMTMMGYIPRFTRRPVVMRTLPPIWEIDLDAPLKLTDTVQYVEEIEWVRRPAYDLSSQYVKSAPAPAKRHRRN